MDFAGFLIGAAGYAVGSGGGSHREKRLHEPSLSPIAPCASAPQNPPRKLGEHPLVQETRVPLFRPKVALVNCEEVFHHLEGGPMAPSPSSGLGEWRPLTELQPPSSSHSTSASIAFSQRVLARSIRASRPY